MIVTSRYSEVMPKRSYVYRHRRASDGSVFYVGKGTRDRAWQVTSACGRSDHWMRVANKNGVIVEILRDDLSDCCALTLEIITINYHRRMGDRIVNVSNGGDGAAGVSRAGIVFRSDGVSFSSCADAARDIASKGKYPLANASKIHQCASGKSRVIYGYSWSFTKVPDPPKTKKQVRRDWYGREVYCSNGMHFHSILDATDWVQDTLGYENCGPNIAACAHGKRPHACGLNWSFEWFPPDPVVTRRRRPRAKLDQTSYQ